ncbi:MAG: DNA-directed RNA polymerase subunit omega [Bacteroidota bacterium]
MSDIKSKVQGLEANIQARDVYGMAKTTKNIYEAIAVISKRATQISVDLKHELHSKLEEFAVSSDTIEEIHENKEQIEISKFYERLPNPVIIAMEEFLSDELHYRYKEEKKSNNNNNNPSS